MRCKQMLAGGAVYVVGPTCKHGLASAQGADPCVALYTVLWDSKVSPYIAFNKLQTRVFDRITLHPLVCAFLGSIGEVTVFLFWKIAGNKLRSIFYENTNFDIRETIILKELRKMDTGIILLAPSPLKPPTITVTTTTGELT